MARILGIDIPDHKKGPIALTYIYGIGRAQAQKILTTTKVNPAKKVKDWTENEAKKIRNLITSDAYTVEGELRAEKRSNIKRLMDIGCYRGQRHRAGLPVRGQRTCTNARTRKGKKKTVAGKKKPTK